MLVALRERYDVQFRQSTFAAQRAVATEKPDAIVLDEDNADDGAHDFLEWLSSETRSPVVVVTSSNTDRSSLASQFGVPSLAKPATTDQLAAAIEVAIEQRLRPVSRRVGG